MCFQGRMIKLVCARVKSGMMNGSVFWELQTEGGIKYRNGILGNMNVNRETEMLLYLPSPLKAIKIRNDRQGKNFFHY